MKRMRYLGRYSEVSLFASISGVQETGSPQTCLATTLPGGARPGTQMRTGLRAAHWQESGVQSSSQRRSAVSENKIPHSLAGCLTGILADDVAEL